MTVPSKLRTCAGGWCGAPEVEKQEDEHNEEETDGLMTSLYKATILGCNY